MNARAEYSRAAPDRLNPPSSLFVEVVRRSESFAPRAFVQKKENRSKKLFPRLLTRPPVRRFVGSSVLSPKYLGLAFRFRLYNPLNPISLWCQSLLLSPPASGEKRSVHSTPSSIRKEVRLTGGSCAGFSRPPFMRHAKYVTFRFALGASDVCLVRENPTCSVPALQGCEGLRSYDYGHA